MKRSLVLLAILLLAPATAQAKVKPLTPRQAFAVLTAAANDLRSRGEDVIAGDCDKPRNLKASCFLWIRRPGQHNPNTFGRPEDACTLGVNVRKAKSGYFYGWRYATGTYMAGGCAKP